MVDVVLYNVSYNLDYQNKYLKFFLKKLTMAHKKGVGSSKNGRDSKSKRLGIKLFGGQIARAGNIIVRQRGTRHYPSNNVNMGKDHTLYAKINGIVKFQKKSNNRSFVSIIPII